MLSNQYLVLAKEIKQNENGVYSYIDICEHLLIKDLPAQGVFDMAIVCGPGWEPGDHHLHIAIKKGELESQKIGFGKVHITDEFHIFTLKINKLSIGLKDNQPFTLQVYQHKGDFVENENTVNMITGDLVIERVFKVFTMSPVS